MSKKEEVLRRLEGKTDEEKRQILSDYLGISLVIPDGGTCKAWFAKVFTYCTADELQRELDFFLFLINLLAFLLNFCFKEEDTVFLGCTCYCGRHQTILYFSITFGD